MIFRCTPLELFKADGKTVCGYGVEWSEPRKYAELSCLALGRLFVMASVISAWGTLVSIDRTIGRKEALLVWGVVTLAAVGLCLFFYRRATTAKGKTQFIEFLNDGRIVSAREGLWKAQVADIRSIEAEQGKQNKQDDVLPYTHGVRMVLRHGRVVHVAKDLEPDAATMLAVMLTEAVDAVKFMPAASTGANPARAEVW